MIMMEKKIRMLLKMMIIMIMFSSPCSGQRWSGRWRPGRSFANLIPRYSVPMAEPEPQPEPFRRWSLSRPFSLPLPEPEPEPEPVSFANRKSRRINQMLKVLPTTTKTTTTTTTTTTITKTTTTTTKTTTEYIRAPREDILSMSTPSPWSINTAQFQIVVAVPEYDMGDEKDFNENIVDEKVEEIDIPRQFMPVPAVPNVSSDTLSRQPKNIVEGVDDAVNIVNLEKSENKNRRCLEKCVQQFCIPDKDISMFSSCVEKCKNFCD